MADTNLKKKKDGYGYKYTDLAEIHNYLENINASYYQFIEPVDGVDYIYTVPTIDGKTLEPRRGCRVVQASLSGKSNPAQEQGSALTYARRYSLLMAFGLATTDDDAACLTTYTDYKQEAKDKAKAIKRLNELCTERNITPTQFAEANGIVFNPNDFELIKRMVASLERKS